MRRFFIPQLLMLAMLLLGSAAHPGQASDSKPDRPQVSKVYSEAVRGTAMVITPQGTGTGWIVDRAKKQMITCQHVVGDNEKVRVVFPIFRDGRVVMDRAEYKDAAGITGNVIHVDNRRDLALIELTELPEGVGELALASTAPEPGEMVHAVGCPGAGLALWVYSDGRVRAVARATWHYDDQIERSAQVVESQVPINPGDSGSALINDAGEVVGVNNASTRDSQLMSLSIEVSEVKQFLKDRVTNPVKPQNRTKWRHNTGSQFEHQGGKNWVEFHPNGNRNTFAEVGRNADYIELYDASRDIGVRLYRTQMYLRQPGEREFKFFRDGKWVQ